MQPPSNRRKQVRDQVVTSNQTFAYAPAVSAAQVQRLTEKARPALLAHFAALSEDDRRLRFGGSTSAERIGAYIAEIDLARDAVFGIFDDSLALVGVAHVAFADGVAELGISVLPE